MDAVLEAANGVSSVGADLSDVVLAKKGDKGKRKTDRVSNDNMDMR